ncbi:MAG: proton-conducting transporter membrane subunit [Pirellulales bacterium]
MIALFSAVVPFCFGLLIVARIVRGRAATLALLIGSIASAVNAGALAMNRTAGSAEYVLGRYFVIDASSTLFLAHISLIFAGISIYYVHRVNFVDLDMVEPPDNFCSRSLFFFASCVLAVLSNQLIAMWVFLELGTLAIAPLIFVGRTSAAVDASWKYLLFSVVGLGFNFVGLMCLARAMGGAHGEHELTFFLDALRTIPSLGESAWWKLGLSLMVFGLGTKIGLAPMYSWCPDAYDEAPPAVTALMACVQFNCVVLAMLREIGCMRSFDSTLISEELIVMGLISILVAAGHIIFATNYKRLIAYASINHAGIIAIGLAVAINTNAAYGLVLYVVSNAFVKAILFLTCGNIKAQYRTKEISALRGIIRVMPFSGWVFMVGVFALLGFPPFGSFLGEVTMLSNMTEGSYLAAFFVICIVLTLILLATGRLLFPMIWADAADEGVRHSDPLGSNIGSIMFIVILISLGIYSPTAVSELIKEVASSIIGQ